MGRKYARPRSRKPRKRRELDNINEKTWRVLGIAPIPVRLVCVLLVVLRIKFLFVCHCLSTVRVLEE